MEEEAVTMIRGLGVYLTKIYGEDAISPLFTAAHWSKNKHWSWNEDKKTFVTPDEKMVEALVNLDSNAVVIGREATILAQEEKQAKTKKMTPAMKMLQRQEKELIDLLKNPDLDHITTMDRPVQEITDTVEFNKNDGESTTSSITDNRSEKSDRTKIMTNSKEGHNSQTSGYESSSTISSVKTSQF